MKQAHEPLLVRHAPRNALSQIPFAPSAVEGRDSPHKRFAKYRLSNGNLRESGTRARSNLLRLSFFPSLH
jgi:hypothetical protein